MELQNNCLGNCMPPQVINFNYAFKFEEVNNIEIYNNDGCKYSVDELEYAYSVDNVCWSCYLSYQDLLNNTVSLNSDFYVKIKVKGVINKVTINNEIFTDYKTSLLSGFTFLACDGTPNNSTVYNPYLNMECAIALQQQLAENVACMIGIPIYYFKLAPNLNSKDLTFKEYTLMDVESVKQIKLVVADGQMPSSKLEFSDFGFEFQTDWETEITKGMFATAFGNTAQPMEGDLIYIPMQKRMWMVNEAYEEKKDALMWNATTFKVMLVKYQEKSSVDLGATESLVNSFVKNKYEDLFGDQETLDSGEESADVLNYEPNNLYPIYESDATRKYVSSDSILFIEQSQYYKGTLITDLCYKFNNKNSKIIYQRKFCGENGTVSFIITPKPILYSGILLNIANIKISIQQSKQNCKLKLVNTGQEISINVNTTYFVFLRWSKQLNIIEISAAQYTHPNMPLYKLQNNHYYFDIDNLNTSISKYNIEMIQDSKGDVIVNYINGTITNIKVFDIYNDNISEILQMYPTNQHLLINDTARKLIDLNGVSIR